MFEIKRIYREASGEPIDAEEIADQLTRSVQTQTSEVSIRDAFLSPIYKSGSGVALMIMALHELTAINAILLYSNTIIDDMPDGSITPRQGTYLIGVFNFFASCCSIYAGKTFSRRFLFICGHLSMGVCHLFVALFIFMH